MLPEALGARFLVCRIEGEIASVVDLYTDGRVGVIDAVMTFEEHRRKGLARTAVLRAVNEARASGCDLAFLHADLDDWPQHLNAKLGFDPIGYEHVFLKTGD